MKKAFLSEAAMVKGGDSDVDDEEDEFIADKSPNDVNLFKTTNAETPYQEDSPIPTFNVDLRVDEE